MTKQEIENMIEKAFAPDGAALRTFIENLDDIHSMWIAALDTDNIIQILVPYEEHESQIPLGKRGNDGEYYYKERMTIKHLTISSFEGSFYMRELYNGDMPTCEKEQDIDWEFMIKLIKNAQNLPKKRMRLIAASE